MTTKKLRDRFIKEHCTKCYAGDSSYDPCNMQPACDDYLEWLEQLIVTHDKIIQE